MPAATEAIWPKHLEFIRENTSFSKKIPGLQLAWDSTSLGLLKTCPYKYYLSVIQGYRSRAEAISLVWGIAFHEGIESYHKLRLAGLSHDDAIFSVTADAVEHCFKSDDNRRTRLTLARALIWYLDEWEESPLEIYIFPDGRPAVELSFRFGSGLYASTSREEFLLCGHQDLIAWFGDDLYGMDHKTSGTTLSPSYFANYSPDNQMTLYTIANKVMFHLPVKGMVIDAVQLAVDFNRFARGFANRTEGQLEEWLADLELWLVMAEAFARKGSWPMNDTSCSKYGGCTFKSICDKDPSVRQMYLDSEFVRKEWDPLVPR